MSAAIFLLLLLVCSFILDSQLRKFLKTDIKVTTEKGREGTLIVYLPGILSSPASGSAFFEIWKQIGSLLLVDYGDNRFDPKMCINKITQAIVAQVKMYERIIFIGSSMGGLLSTDVIEELRKKNCTIPIDLIILDSPTSSADFQMPNRLFAPLLRILPFGPLWNCLNLVSKLFVSPKEENIEPGVNKAELATSVAWAKHYRLSFWRDQLCYIMRHGKLPNDCLDGKIKSLTYVRSSRDNDTVSPTAYHSWRRAFLGANKINVDSTHVGFAERPVTWSVAFYRLLRGV